MVEEIIAEVRQGLSGDKKKDLEYIRSKNEIYCKHENAKEILDALGKLTLEVVSNKKVLSSEEIEKINREINLLHDKAIELIENRELGAAKEVLKEAISLIPNKEEGGKLQFSFKSVLELWLFVNTFKPKVEINQTYTDNSSIYKLYAYIEAQLLNIDNAIENLHESLKWNPVNVGSLLELSEINRVKMQYDNFINLIKNALALSLSSSDLGRCYLGLARYYRDVKEYDTSVCLYYVSNSFSENNVVIQELTKMKMELDIDIEPPTVEETERILKSKEIQLGPSQYVINTIFSLAEESKKNNSMPIYKYCKDVFRDLTKQELSV